MKTIQVTLSETYAPLVKIRITLAKNLANQQTSATSWHIIEARQVISDRSTLYNNTDLIAQLLLARRVNTMKGDRAQVAVTFKMDC